MYSKIIYFEGIFLRDLRNMKVKYKLQTRGFIPEYIKSLATPFADYLNVYNDKYGKYSSIPTHFADLDTWPKHTNLKCWNCSLPFSGMPWFIPNGTCKRVCGDDEITVMIVYGNFCSPNCSVNYLINSNDRNIVDAATSKKLLYGLYEKVTGDRGVISPFPSYTILRQYKGPSGISSKDYRKHYKSYS